MRHLAIFSLPCLLALAAASAIHAQPPAPDMAPPAPPRLVIKAGSADALLLESAIKLRREGKIESAISDLQQLAATYPSEYRAQYNLGLALTEANQLDEAEAAFKQAIVAKGKAEISDGGIYNTIGWLYYLKGEDAQARDWLEKAIDSKESMKQETRLRVLNNLGLVYLRQGDFKKAQASLGEAVRMGSKRAEINLKLVDEVQEQAKAAKDDP